MTSESQTPQNPWLATRTRTGAEYDAPYEIRAQMGQDIHGEANLIEKLMLNHNDLNGGQPPYHILDAGCGTGRLAIELSQRGFKTVGVDLDEVMLHQAKAKAPDLAWILGDLSTVQLDKQFDAIVMAGNVIIYLTPSSQNAAIKNMVAHLKPHGWLVAAFELTPQPWQTLTLPEFNKLCSAAGLSQVACWSTWEQAPWQVGDTYVVTYHRFGSR